MDWSSIRSCKQVGIAQSHKHHAYVCICKDCNANGACMNIMTQFFSFFCKYKRKISGWNLSEFSTVHTEGTQKERPEGIQTQIRSTTTHGHPLARSSIARWGHSASSLSSGHPIWQACTKAFYVLTCHPGQTYSKCNTLAQYILPPFLNISLCRDFTMDYIRSKMSESTL
mgnify:CR=1 FL=1